MIKLSIVVPTYNRKADLQRCLNSLYAEAAGGYEVVLVDDCSTDGTHELLDTLPFSNLKVLRNPVNKGVNFTRNRGIEAAEGEYLMFIDSDDMLLPGGLAEVLRQLEAQKDVKHFLFYVTSNEPPQRSDARTVTYEDWLAGRVAGDYTHVVQRKIVRNHLFFEQFRAYEYLNWLRIFKITSPQTVVPRTITWVDTARTDNLTKTLKLRTTQAIETKFRSMALFFSLYGKDLYAVDPALYHKKFNHALLLGLACYRKEEALRMLRDSPVKGRNWLVWLVSLSPARAVNLLVRLKSASAS